jgi:hypothetical protein
MAWLVLVFSTIAFLWPWAALGASILLAGLVLAVALLAAPSVLVAVGDKAPGPDAVSSHEPAPRWCCPSSPPASPPW